MENKKPIYIIEHLELELFEWCLIEYEHTSKIVGKENLWFTNIKSENDRKKLENLGKVYAEGVRKLKLNKACIFDPEAEKTINPEELKSFDYYIFGGILGDFPPQKRTKEELTIKSMNIEARNIGKEQMSTDNAVYSVKQLAEKGKKFSDLKFKDNISIKINEFESIELPYRYNIVNGKPLINKKILAYLKRGSAHL